MSKKTRAILKGMSPAQKAALSLGVVAASLGCYGAWTYAYQLEGGASYLTFAAPVIAASAALIPAIAENAWRQRQRFKALLWWLVFIPAAGVVFFASAERVHVAKAGSQAVRDAERGAVNRAASDLKEAKEALNTAVKRQLRRPENETFQATVTAAQLRVNSLETVLKQAEARAVSDPTNAPTWLLPIALDLVAFMGLWTGLSKPMSNVTLKTVSKRRIQSKKRPATVVQLVKEKANGQ